MPAVADYAELNAHLRACSTSDLTRRLRGTSLAKQQLLEEGRVAGLALRPECFDARRQVSTTATSEALVRFDTNDYSVPVAYAHRPVVVKASVNTVNIFHAGERIADHHRCWQREQQIFEPMHYLPLPPRSSPAAGDPLFGPCLLKSALPRPARQGVP